MNKTLLLIICDFLLLNLIHFTSWDTLDNETENPATGGSTTAIVYVASAAALTCTNAASPIRVAFHRSIAPSSR